MSDDKHPAGTGEHDSTGWIVLGAALVVVGLFLGGQQLGIVPWPFTVVWGHVVQARYGIGVLIAGILLIVWAQSGHRFTAPARGAKLYRSRDGKWLAGVLGGLAEYFNVDVTLLRLAFIALVVLLDMGALVAAYIVMAIVVPQEPESVPQSVATAAPAPAPTVAPAPPVEAAPSPVPDAPADEPPAGVTQA